MSYRTHKCGKIDSKLAGTEVEVVGWVNKRRDHGGVIFFDLRDESGVVQVVFDPDNKEIYLTDIINILIRNKKRVSVLKVENWKRLVGLNTKEDVDWIESQGIV